MFHAKDALLDARTGQEVRGYEFYDPMRWAEPSPYRLTLFEAADLVDGAKIIYRMEF